jgi:hypothetical protein
MWQFFLNTQVTYIFELFFPRKNYILHLGPFITNSSGHPGYIGFLQLSFALGKGSGDNLNFFTGASYQRIAVFHFGLGSALQNVSR